MMEEKESEQEQLDLSLKSAIPNNRLLYSTDNIRLVEKPVAMVASLLLLASKRQGSKQRKKQPRKQGSRPKPRSQSAREPKRERQPFKPCNKWRIVEIDKGNLFTRDLEMLRTTPEHIASLVGESSPMDCQEGIRTGFRPGTNPLEQLGLFRVLTEIVLGPI